MYVKRNRRPFCAHESGEVCDHLFLLIRAAQKSLVRNRGKSAEELGLGEVIRFARGRGGLAPREIERISG